MVNRVLAPDSVPGLGELEGLFAARQPAPEPRARPGTEVAAVFVLFAEREAGPAIVLTRRSQRVAHHRGEVSFPGGVAEPGDSGLLDTARREVVEELGVQPSDVEPWGTLSPVDTTTGFVVLPFTGRLANPDGVSPCADEVDEVFTAPISTLLDPGSVRDMSMLTADGLRSRPAYVCDGQVIWGATAVILAEVLEIIGRRVAPERT